MATTQDKYKKNREEFEAATGSTAVATRPTTSEALSTVVDRRGKEGIESSDLILPRLLAAQKSSSQIEEGNENFIPDLKLGQLFHSISGQNFGNGPVKFAVVKLRKHAKQYDPKNPKNVLDHNVPWDDPRCEFGPKGEKPVATRFYEFLIILADSIDPVFFSLKSTQTKVAKKLISLYNAADGPAWSMLYSVTSAVKTFPAGVGVQFSITRGEKTPDVVAAKAEEIYNLGQTNVIKSDVDETDTEVEPTDDKVPF